MTIDNFRKASWEIYPSATFIWSLISMTRRKPNKKYMQWIFQKKDKEDIFEKKIFFLTKRRNIKDLRNKGSVGKHRGGSKSGQVTEQEVDHINTGRPGKKLKRFSACNGEFKIGKQFNVIWTYERSFWLLCSTWFAGYQEVRHGDLTENCTWSLDIVAWRKFVAEVMRFRSLLK